MLAACWALGLGACIGRGWLSADAGKRQSAEEGAVLQGGLTAKGRQLASLPVEPVWGAVLLAAAHLGCLQDALVIVAMASTDPLFVKPRCCRPRLW